MGKGLLVSKVLPGQLDDLVKLVMKKTGTDNPEEAVRLINSGECDVAVKKLSESPPWRRDEDGVIYFELISPGYSGKDWIARLSLQSQYCIIQVLSSPKFIRAPKRTVTQVAVLPARWLEKQLGRECSIDDAKAEAKRRGWSLLLPEAGCLIRERFGSLIENMGLRSIEAIHKPIPYHVVGQDMDPDYDTIGRLETFLPLDSSEPLFHLSSAHHDQGSNFGFAQCESGFAFQVSRKISEVEPKEG